MRANLNLQRKGRQLDRKVDPRHGKVKGLLDDYWSKENPSIPSLPWGAGDAGALGAFLRANPTLTVETVHTCLVNRMASEDHAAGERVMVWIGHILRYAAGPLNRFGQPMRVSSEATVGVARPGAESVTETAPLQTIRQQMSEAWFHKALQRRNLGLGLSDLQLACLKEEGQL